MLKLQTRNGTYFYSIFKNPVSRVMKFKRFSTYFQSLPEGETVLDYGAGDQPMRPMLETKFKTYIAADYAPSNAAHQRRPDVLITDDGLDWPSNSVDCIVLTEVLEHIYKPLETLEELYRILKPGGAIIGTVPFSVGEHEQPYDFHRYTYFCLKRMFEDSHYCVESLEYVGDTVGVMLSNFSRTLGIITKGLYKMKLGIIAQIFNLLIRIPELIYYIFVSIGVNPARIGYYQSNPMGFTFHISKPVKSSINVRD